MTDTEINRKLEKLETLANELVAEAKRRYGPDGNLFFEAGGVFYVMDGDGGENAGFGERQSHVRFTSKGYCRMGAGAW